MAFTSTRSGYLLEGSYGESAALYRTTNGGRRWWRASLRTATGLLASGRRLFVVHDHRIYEHRPHRFTLLGPALGPELFALDGSLYDYDSTKYRSHWLTRIKWGKQTTTRLPCGTYNWSSALTGLPDGTLLIVCGSEGGTGTQPRRDYRSFNDGRTWQRSPGSGVGGYIGAGAAGLAGAFVYGDRAAVLTTDSPYRRWHFASVVDDDQQVPDLGFWKSRFGWAATPGSTKAMWLTNDGGRRWHPAVAPPRQR